MSAMVAMDCFEKALAIDPQFYAGSIGAALNVGSLYMDLRYYRDAQPFFEHVLELDPENEMARTKLAQARSLAKTSHEPVDRKTASKIEDDEVFNLEDLPEPPKKKKKKKKRKPFTNLEI